ncbi:UDP-N-acetylglucosamine 2-epimerase (non-hydrolyzing) [Gemmobacter sp. 24YEA27]|uniref:non-hydrolyzing UDP-N-acetylglucosamine 2-epimerase n=1 Tax=Gemmobacter sp. 24YEA27 TaxID=3040672 RepID=UPI0024B33B38|nr:UDP-N-acetylglucosamine 2-epimerase (non-hydrolyzing) [Gemmobacter sp. 24YEA27]
MTKSILTVVGARPQFVKAGAVSRALRAHPELTEWIVHTGQHHDANMSDIFFTEMDIPAPRWSLDIHGGQHGEMTGRMLAALETVMVENRPDLVLVYGDTNSTLAGALAAAKLGIPIAHVEAGLRSFNRAMPEEINRVLTDHLSALLFCPTGLSVRNLAAEGITGPQVHEVGDVMFDATLHARGLSAARSDILRDLGLTPKSYCLATIHRAENTSSPEKLARVIAYLREAAAAEGVPLVLPLHPRTRQVAASLDLDGIMVIEPQGYFDFHRLLGDARLMLTDSGGVQKEAYFHSVPCVTLRDETEWVETIEAGWNRLWTQKGQTGRRSIPDYGTGDSAGAITRILSDFLYRSR